MGVDNKFSEKLKEVIGLDVASTIFGCGTGSVIDISFGEMVPRKRPLKNSSLSERDRNFETFTSILIHCAWRLKNNHSVLHSWRESDCWRDSKERSDPLSLTLLSLKGEKVSNVSFDKVSHDLEIVFDNGIILEVVADITDEEESEFNYHFFFQDGIYSARFDGTLEFEARLRSV